VIGLTSCSNINNLLERRIRSRLNAQYVYLKPPTTTHICSNLVSRITYPCINYKRDKDNINNNKEYNNLLIIDDKKILLNDYLKTFINNVYHLFGNYNDNASPFKLGVLSNLVQGYVDFETGSYLNTAAQFVISELSLGQPYITKELFINAIKSMVKLLLLLLFILLLLLLLLLFLLLLLGSCTIDRCTLVVVPL
jgi:hypothetical protein